MTIQEIQANKSVTKADIKFITEFIQPLKETVFINPYSGESLTASGIMAGLINFTWNIGDCSDYSPEEHRKELTKIHPSLTSKNWVSKFDRARHLILKLNISVYMTLID